MNKYVIYTEIVGNYDNGLQSKIVDDKAVAFCLHWGICIGFKWLNFFIGETLKKYFPKYYVLKKSFNP